MLGLYEISGLRFDHLWVLGLHNDNWPPAAKPNPFIPGKLQKAAQFPRSSPQRELEVARTITQRLLETAPDCVFSYPGLLDGEVFCPAHCLNRSEIETQWRCRAGKVTTGKPSCPRPINPETDPLVMPGQLTGDTARGGSSILKHQALCPFRAFASNRLGADGLETPADGISPMLHGSLMHKVLGTFWRETRTGDTLLALDEESLEHRSAKHVDSWSDEECGLITGRVSWRRRRPACTAMAMAWLDLEKRASPFEVIGFEKEILPEIEGQTIRLIIDRIDRLAVR